MSLRKSSLRILRNLFYRRFTKAEERFRKINRSFLRAIMPDSNPIDEAPQITNRKTDDRWKSMQPVWVLSTGRTGTNTMTELFKLSPRIEAFHEPAPELFQFSYDYFMNQIDRREARKTLAYLRDELVFRSIRDGFTFIETNNRVAYIADLLLELYPASKFIYVYRNPYNFIRSGMRRNYYRGHMRDYARIEPTKSDLSSKAWEDFSEIQKVAWNWKTVNRHCLNFIKRLPDHQKMSFSSETFFEAAPSLTKQLFDFIGSPSYHPPASDISRVMGKKHNAQKQGHFSKPTDWTDHQVEQVNKIVAPIAQELSYELIPTESLSQS